MSDFSPKRLSQEQQEQLEPLKIVLFGGRTEETKLSAYKLVRFSTARLRQFNLQSNHQASDVIREVYKIASRKILDGEQVNNLEAWTKQIALYIIKDFSKKEINRKKQIGRLIEKGFYSDDRSNHLIIENEELDPIKTKCLNDALDSLSEEEKHILNLRIQAEYSWKKIASELGISTENARQRGNRTLKKLRKTFFSIYEVKSLG